MPCARFDSARYLIDMPSVFQRVKDGGHSFERPRFTFSFSFRERCPPARTIGSMHRRRAIG